MSKNNSLLTIKEFATAAGVSKQTIYNQLNGRLKPFVKVVNGTKMLKKSALEEFYSCEDNQPVNQSVNQPVNNQLNKEFDEKLLKILEKQLETKDKQIEELNKRLAETLAKMANIMEQQQILLSQQQKLTLIEKKEEVKEDIKEPAELEEPQAQKNFWSRLFNK